MDEALKKALEIAAKKLPRIRKPSTKRRRGIAQLASALGITTQAVSQWKKVPHERVLAVENLTGVSRYQLRPDIYGPERGRAA